LICHKNSRATRSTFLCSSTLPLIIQNNEQSFITTNQTISFFLNVAIIVTGHNIQMSDIAFSQLP
jgi:hypothetical protein